MENIETQNDRNILAIYKEVAEKIAQLEKQKEILKAGIFAAMDAAQNDEFCVDGFKAKRTLVVQSRIDSKLAEAVLGDRINEIKKEIETVRLTVL